MTDLQPRTRNFVIEMSVDGHPLIMVPSHPYPTAEAALDALNEKISEAVSRSGEAQMPTTRVRGRTSLRVCFLHYENDEGDVEHLVQLVSRLGSSLAR